MNNANLGEETTPEHVLRMTGFAEEFSEMTGLPLRFTTVKESLYNALRGRIEPLMPPAAAEKDYFRRRKNGNSNIFDTTLQGCGLCVSACPKHIVELDKTKLNAKGHHPAM